MKSQILISKLSTLLIGIFLLSACTSDKVVTQGPIQKRKYRKGYYIDWAQKKSAKHQVKVYEEQADATPASENLKSVKSEKPAEINTSPPNAGPQRQEAAYASTDIEEEMVAPGKDESPVLGMNKVKQMKGNPVRIMEQVKKLNQKLNPEKKAGTTELDPLLKKAIIFGVAAVLVSIVASIFSYVIGFWLIYLLFWLVAVACWIVAIYFFIKWLMQQ